MERLVIHYLPTEGIIESGGDKETTPKHQGSGPPAPGRRNLGLSKPAAKSQFCEGCLSKYRFGATCELRFERTLRSRHAPKADIRGHDQNFRFAPMCGRLRVGKAF